MLGHYLEYFRSVMKVFRYDIWIMKLLDLILIAVGNVLKEGLTAKTLLATLVVLVSYCFLES